MLSKPEIRMVAIAIRHKPDESVACMEAISQGDGIVYANHSVNGHVIKPVAFLLNHRHGIARK